jgi:hypothetical protein
MYMYNIHTMTSFKQFGGLGYNGTHNITRSTFASNTDLTITGSEGSTNTRTISNSHIDMSGASILKVNSIYFSDGSILSSALNRSHTQTWNKDHNDCSNTIDCSTNIITGDVRHNTSLGKDNLINATHSAKYNSALGESVLTKNRIGYANSAVGYESLANNTQGNFNTAIGLQALAFNVVGTHCTAIGASADVTSASLVNATAIGSEARVSASNTIVLGNNNVTDVITSGSITGLSKNFTIPHPISEMEAEGHKLKHASVESPRLDLIYRDTTVLKNGKALIDLDSSFHMTKGTFSALCKNTSVFVSNETDWDPVRGFTENSILHIQCKNEESSATVSYMVVAERKDEGILDSTSTDAQGRFIPEPAPEKN